MRLAMQDGFKQNVKAGDGSRPIVPHHIPKHQPFIISSFHQVLGFPPEQRTSENYHNVGGQGVFGTKICPIFKLIKKN